MNGVIDEPNMYRCGKQWRTGMCARRLPITCEIEPIYRDEIISRSFIRPYTSRILVILPTQLLAMSSPERVVSSKSSSESNVENLTVMLKEHFKLIEKKAESKKITASARHLLDTFNTSIERLPDNKLSEKGKEGVKDAISAFVDKRNRELTTSLIKRAKDGEFKELDALLTTFSRVNSKHMKRMKVTILEPEPVEMILERKKESRIFQHYRDLFEKKIKPSNETLQYFTSFEYPMFPDNVVPMSEIVAKHKIISLFRLADQARVVNGERDLCWVLLPELLLFELTATSGPSEIKTNCNSPVPHESSTFLTGRADMVIVSFVEKAGSDSSSSTILTDQMFREAMSKIYNQKREGLTYQEVHRVSRNLIKAHADEIRKRTGPDGWEVLMLEAKRQGFVKLEVTDLVDDGKDDGKDSDDGKDGEEVYDEVQGDGEKKIGEIRTGEDEDEEGESELEDEGSEGEGEDEVVLPEEIEIQGTETTVQKSLCLKDYLPQVISQCIAVKTGSPALGPKIIKFVLADGDNWIFGLVNCSGEKKGRKCLTTTVNINPQQRDKLSDRILCVLELLVLWSSASGKHLQTLFSKH
ncbi:hypothetical protein D9756_006233 [Leucocoprinus leucothites]|uniref:Uncharacterized protein n=1 Tax=Leucocoprinus leucothites TaxID=201217 RepID=A0A8H5FXN5_9AGAR|nr:hypothetical protein D9756_006233 [Leucoagaricus leucothites]